MDRAIMPLAEVAALGPAPDPPPAARLAFVERPRVTIRLRYPFFLNGLVVDTIEINRLTTADLIRLAATNGDLFDAYGLMTGLDPSILRGLDADDGDQLTTAAHALLPGVLTRGAEVDPSH